MATMLADELAYCMGCDAGFADDAALTAHQVRCEQHPLAAHFTQLRALDSAVRAWHVAKQRLDEACADHIAELAEFRALWAAEQRLRALIGEGA